MGSCKKTGCLCLYINILCLLDVKGNIVAKGEEKTEVINVFFASPSFIARPVIVGAASLLNW